MSFYTRNQFEETASFMRNNFWEFCADEALYKAEENCTSYSQGFHFPDILQLEIKVSFFKLDKKSISKS